VAILLDMVTNVAHNVSMENKYYFDMKKLIVLMEQQNIDIKMLASGLNRSLKWTKNFLGGAD